MTSLKTNTILIFLMLAVGSMAVADSGIPFVGWISPASQQEVSLFILPDGSGPPLTEARQYGGQVVDGNIVIALIDVLGYAIPNFPAEDLWLDAETTTDSQCLFVAPGGFRPDSNTDINGETVFATSLSGGGWTEGPVWVYLNGSRAVHPDDGELVPVPLRFNSADINNDGTVDLADVGLFATDYRGAYHYRCDFLWDGVLDLGDIGLLAQGMGAKCE